MIRRLLPDKTTCLSALSGFLMACSFPLPDYYLLAWLGLVPLIMVMPNRPFKSGFVAGIVFFAVTLYWLNIVMTTYGHLPLLLSFLLYLLLAAYLAFYWAIASWAACRLKEFRSYSFALTLPVFWVMGLATYVLYVADVLAACVLGSRSKMATSATKSTTHRNATRERQVQLASLQATNAVSYHSSYPLCFKGTDRPKP